MEESIKIYDKITVFDRIDNLSNRRGILFGIKYTGRKRVYP